jgi:hypothetical protein
MHRGGQAVGLHPTASTSFCRTGNAIPRDLALDVKQDFC